MGHLGGTDFIEAGSGPRVVLIHSSVAGARQWGSLMAALSDRYHVIAINLHGYGATAPWPDDQVQSLDAQARLVAPFLPDDGSSISIVGHSFGGSVAMKAAALFKEQVERLVLIEPNPFYLLREHGCDAAFAEAAELRDVIKQSGAEDTWPVAAEVFANYWTGQGSWDAMPEERRAKFTTALKPNFQEWDAVMNEATPLSDWARDLPQKTTVISSADTVHSIEAIVALMAQHIPQWTYDRMERGGHMAAMTKPDQINPIIERALQG